MTATGGAETGIVERPVSGLPMGGRPVRRVEPHYPVSLGTGVAGELSQEPDRDKIPALSDRSGIAGSTFRWPSRQETLTLPAAAL